MSIWSVLFNILFVCALASLCWAGKKMEAAEKVPSRWDYITVLLFGFSGVVNFATCSKTMTTDLFRGWVDAVIGFGTICAVIWLLTLYRRLKKSY